MAKSRKKLQIEKRTEMQTGQDPGITYKLWYNPYGVQISHNLEVVRAAQYHVAQSKHANSTKTSYIE